MVRQIAKALRANLSKNRRCAEDTQRFGSIGELYAHVKAVPSGNADRCQRLYEWNRGRPDLCIVKSHWQPRNVNAYLNGFYEGGYAVRAHSVGHVGGARTHARALIRW